MIAVRHEPPRREGGIRITSTILVTTNMGQISALQKPRLQALRGCELRKKAECVVREEGYAIALGSSILMHGAAAFSYIVFLDEGTSYSKSLCTFVKWIAPADDTGFGVTVELHDCHGGWRLSNANFERLELVLHDVIRIRLIRLNWSAPVR
jgi:hypothetical protein